MKEELISRKTITYGDEFLAEMELCYLITEKENNLPGENKYGVRIIKETIENGARISEDNTSDLLFRHYEEALEFINMLIKYEVTPIALQGVAEDYICDCKEMSDMMTA